MSAPPAAGRAVRQGAFPGSAGGNARDAAGRPRQLAVELCVDDVAGALLAERSGLDRIELCSALSEGGLTPSIGTVGRTLEVVEHVGVQVLVRARPGHFTYDEDEVVAMERDIDAIARLDHADGVTVGFVLGALTPAAALDMQVLRRLLEACGPAPVTFHRAFDLVGDLDAALEELATTGVSRVLTSGGAPTAAAGATTLARLVATTRSWRPAAGSELRERDGDPRVGISIIAAGGVRAGNVTELVARTGVSDVHVSARTTVPQGNGPPAVSLTASPVPTGSASRPDPVGLDALCAALAPWRDAGASARGQR